MLPQVINLPERKVRQERAASYQAMAGTFLKAAKTKTHCRGPVGSLSSALLSNILSVWVKNGFIIASTVPFAIMYTQEQTKRRWSLKTKQNIIYIYPAGLCSPACSCTSHYTFFEISTVLFCFVLFWDTLRQKNFSVILMSTHPSTGECKSKLRRSNGLFLFYRFA